MIPIFGFCNDGNYGIVDESVGFFILWIIFSSPWQWTVKTADMEIKHSDLNCNKSIKIRLLLEPHAYPYTILRYFEMWGFPQLVDWLHWSHKFETEIWFRLQRGSLVYRGFSWFDHVMFIGLQTYSEIKFWYIRD